MNSGLFWLDHSDRSFRKGEICGSVPVLMKTMGTAFSTYSKRSALSWLLDGFWAQVGHGCGCRHWEAVEILDGSIRYLKGSCASQIKLD